MRNGVRRKATIAMCLAIALCLLAPIGVNQAFASYRQQQNQEYRDVLQSPGYLDISGNWTFYDRDDDLVPAKYFCVGLFNVTGEQLVLYYVYTDDDGHFCFYDVPNPGGEIRVKIYTYIQWECASGDYEVMVVESNGSGWGDTYVEDDYIGPFDDGSWDVGNLTVPSEVSNRDAWWIQDDMNKGFLKAPDPAGDYTAEWDPDWEQGCGYIPGGHIMISEDGAENTSDCVLHEMGHNLMWNIYGSLPPGDCGDEHWFGGATDEGCAWAEGWASYWALVVDEDGNAPNFNWPGGQFQNLETPSWDEPGWDDGDEVEGRVAGAMWDLIDSPADYWDQYECDFAHQSNRDIWDTFYAECHDTFQEFWIDWQDGASDEVFFAANGALYQSTIDYPDNRLVQGDASEDGDVDTGDVIKVKRMILGLDLPTVGADANKDREIDVGDVICIKRIILGLGC